jgi:uncharacterized protein (DUF1778 family)
MPNRAKTERLEARLTAHQKRLLTEAAELVGETISEFVLRAAEVRANMAIVEENLSRLTDRDRAALIDALTAPPQPNEALQQAYRKYRAKFD